MTDSLFGADIESADALIKENEEKASRQKDFEERAITNVPESPGITVRFATNPSPETWVRVWERWEKAAGPNGLLIPCAKGETNSEGNPASTRYLVAAVNTRENKAVVLKLAKTLVDSLLLKYNSKGTLINRDWTLTRYGTGKDTQYDAEGERESERDLSRFTFANLKEIWSKHAEEINALDNSVAEVEPKKKPLE